MTPNYLYLFLDIISILFPLAFSFHPKFDFSKKWKYLWPSIFATAMVFILWDIVFTEKGVWGFNPDYIIGIYLYNLPLEEILFFVCIPYACVFIYDSLNFLIKKDWLGEFAPNISAALCLLLVSIGLLNAQRSYTCVTFIITGAFLGSLRWVSKPTFLGRFYVSFIVTLLPFFMVNGILTGSFISEPVVWYNSAEMLGVRIGTIPLEDIFYGMLLILVNVWFFEKLQNNARIG